MSGRPRHMRYSGKPDGPVDDIRKALRGCGCEVEDLGAVGGGVPDLLVYRKATGCLRLIEVKSEDGELNDSQRKFARRMPVWVARTVEEALQVMGLEKAR